MRANDSKERHACLCPVRQSSRTRVRNIRQLRVLVLHASHIHAAADEQIVFISPAVELPRFFWRQNCQAIEASFVKPYAQFVNSVVKLILRCPPVKCITDAIFIAWMRAEIRDLIQRPIHNWYAAKNRADMAKRH